MLLGFDIDSAAQPEHDDWHSHEHLPERLAIPGFVRGSRWRALTGGLPYFVLYEVVDLAVLTSRAYMDRLNQPSPWTTKMMPSYRGMRRGLCELVARSGHGLGGFGLLLRFDVQADAGTPVIEWLAGEVLSALAAKSGVASAMLFRSRLQAALTVEQRIRGPDADVARALFVTGFARAAIDSLACGLLRPSELEEHGAGGVKSATYQLSHCVSDRDLAFA